MTETKCRHLVGIPKTFWRGHIFFCRPYTKKTISWHFSALKEIDGKSTYVVTPTTVRKLFTFLFIFKYWHTLLFRKGCVCKVQMMASHSRWRGCIDVMWSLASPRDYLHGHQFCLWAQISSICYGLFRSDWLKWKWKSSIINIFPRLLNICL